MTADQSPRTSATRSAIANVRYASGPETLDRFNNLPAVKLFGEGKPGVSSGQAIAEVERIAREEVPPGVPMAQWALAWCLRNEAVTSVIPGSKDVAQVESNAAAAELINGLARAQWRCVDRPLDYTGLEGGKQEGYPLTGWVERWRHSVAPSRSVTRKADTRPSSWKPNRRWAPQKNVWRWPFNASTLACAVTAARSRGRRGLSV